MGRRLVNLEAVGLPVETALISSAIAARYWGVSRQMVSKLVKNGQVEARRIGGSVLIPREVVLAIAQRGLASRPGPVSSESLDSDGLMPLERLASDFGALKPANVQACIQEIAARGVVEADDLRSMLAEFFTDHVLGNKPLVDGLAHKLPPGRLRQLELAVEGLKG
jgi:excisionase family DNA binding protein